MGRGDLGHVGESGEVGRNNQCHGKGRLCSRLVPAGEGSEVN